MATPKPPKGYESWLDYAIATMDTRSEYLARLDAGEDVTRESMREAAQDELNELKALADLSKP